MERLGELRAYAQKMRDLGYLPVGFFSDRNREGLAEALGELLFQRGDKRRGYKIAIQHTSNFDFSPRPADGEGHIIYRKRKLPEGTVCVCNLRLKNSSFIAL